MIVNMRYKRDFQTILFNVSSTQIDIQLKSCNLNYFPIALFSLYSLQHTFYYLIFRIKKRKKEIAYPNPYTCGGSWVPDIKRVELLLRVSESDPISSSVQLFIYSIDFLLESNIIRSISFHKEFHHSIIWKRC